MRTNSPESLRRFLEEQTRDVLDAYISESERIKKERVKTVGNANRTGIYAVWFFISGYVVGFFSVLFIVWKT